MTTVANDKLQNVIPASARREQRNKIMPSKAFCNSTIWKHTKLPDFQELNWHCYMEFDQGFPIVTRERLFHFVYAI